MLALCISSAVINHDTHIVSHGEKFFVKSDGPCLLWIPQPAIGHCRESTGTTS